MQAMKRGLLLAGLLALGATACSKDQQNPPPHTAHNVPAAAAMTQSDEPPADRSNERDTAVIVSREIVMRCELPDSPMEAPRFEYDESSLRPRGENILDAVALCLTRGPMKGQTVTLVGHTDPRGSDAYNQQLGRDRAAAVRDYLVQRGVPAGQLATISRGEQMASGRDEPTWAFDRRVEVELGSLSAPSEGRLP